MAILSIHQWSDKEAGLREMRRVTRGRIVLLTFDPSHRPWLTDYLPELASLDEVRMPKMSDYERWLGLSELLLFWSRTIAATASCMPTGVAQRPISTSVYDQGVPLFAPLAIPNEDYRG